MVKGGIIAEGKSAYLESQQVKTLLNLADTIKNYALSDSNYLLSHGMSQQQNRCLGSCTDNLMILLREPLSQIPVTTKRVPLVYAVSRVTLYPIEMARRRAKDRPMPRL